MEDDQSPGSIQGELFHVTAASSTRRHSKVDFELALLALMRIKGAAGGAVRRLVEFYGEHLGAALEAEPAELRSVLGPRYPTQFQAIASRDVLYERAQIDRHELRRLHSRIIGPGQLPDALLNVPGAPRWLFVQGDPNVLSERPLVAAIGTRSPSNEGNAAARAVIRTLAAYDVGVVSGLARGIDTVVHRASLDDGIKNVAVLAHGLDITFPRENESLRREIIERGGVVVSEYMLGQDATRGSFVERNRVQAALSRLVIGVEGNGSSGSAHTIRFAAKFGRGVAATVWPGVTGISDLVGTIPGSALFPIFDQNGRRRLDAAIREIAERSGSPAFALSLVERQLRREFDLRSVRREDITHVRQLLDSLEAEGYSRWPRS